MTQDESENEFNFYWGCLDMKDIRISPIGTTKFMTMTPKQALEAFPQQEKLRRFLYVSRVMGAVNRNPKYKTPREKLDATTRIIRKFDKVHEQKESM